MDATTKTKPVIKDVRVSLYALPDITQRGNFSRSHLYNLVSLGRFPRPSLKLGPRFTRWSAADVDAWFDDPAAWIAANVGG